MEISIEKCAELIRDSYDISKRLSLGESDLTIKAHLDKNGAQALLTNANVLLIPGTNELSDWWKNFDVFHITGKLFSARSTAKSGSRVHFHAGFWRHAMQIHAFAKTQNVEFIIGHSLGAAATQILGAAMDIPAVAFASPRVKRGPHRIKNEGRVLNVCRADDLVTRVPPSEAGFRRLGKTIRLMPPTINKGMDHSMDEYITALSFDAFEGQLPNRWS